jgi:hypothetical protein
MEILSENEDKLKLSWSPGCYFDGDTYILGEIGRRGPGVTEEDLKKPWICSGLQSSLQFFIRFKNVGDIDLYYRIEEIIIKNTNQIDVKFVPPPLQKDRLELKDEYKEQFNIITKENETLREKYLNLVAQLKELGCDCNDTINYKSILKEWYNWVEYYDATKAGINICCHNKTEFYIYLKDNGMLDKYFPEWYKLGKF